MKIFKDISFDQNCYLIDINNKWFLIDPGYNYKEVIKYLKENNIKLESVLLTHYHFDHVEGVNEICASQNVQAYIHENDYDLLLDNDLSDQMGFCSVPINKEHIISYTELKKEWGISFIHTPGHSDGSVCYLINGDCFTGDTLFVDSIGRYDLPGSSLEKLQNSLKIITRNKDISNIYPGHGNNDKLDKIRENNKVLEEVLKQWKILN